MTERESGNRYIIPALVLLTFVTIYPVSYVFYLSLHRRLLIFDISQFIGFDNYLFLSSDDRFWNALKNTTYFTTLSISLELLLGLCIAVLLSKPFKFRGRIRAVVLI